MEFSLTLVLIAVTCLSSYYAWQNPQYMKSSMFTPYLIHHKGEYQRFVLSGFIHHDGTQLLFNMFTFYYFGNFVEQFLVYKMGMISGWAVYVLFYLIAIVIADIPTFIKHKND